MNRVLRRVQVGGLVLGSVMVLTAADTGDAASGAGGQEGSACDGGQRAQDGGQLFLAAGQAESGGAGLSRGGERVHRCW